MKTPRLLALAGMFPVLTFAAGILAGAALPATAAPAAHTTPASSTAGTDYSGPFTTAKVPAPCVTTTAHTRYYVTSPPDTATNFRSGEHGHGDRIRCIYFSSGGETGGVQYGKWLVFDPATHGWLIAAAGNDVSYVNCGLPGYRFPPPPFTGANDCGESWVTDETQPYMYKTGPSVGQTMFPAILP